MSHKAAINFPLHCEPSQRSSSFAVGSRRSICSRIYRSWTSSSFQALLVCHRLNSSSGAFNHHARSSSCLLSLLLTVDLIPHNSHCRSESSRATKMNQKKNHLHAVSRLKAVNEEEDQGKRAERRCWLFLTSLTRKAQLQEVELEKQPSSSKRRLQSLAKKRSDVRQQKKGYHISYRISNFKAQKKRPDKFYIHAHLLEYRNPYEMDPLQALDHVFSKDAIYFLLHRRHQYLDPKIPTMYLRVHFNVNLEKKN
ncbi:hypothetical protein YC2023_050743 [Brassica napus]